MKLPDSYLSITNQAEVIYQEIFALNNKLDTEAYAYRTERTEQFKDLYRLCELRKIHGSLLIVANEYLNLASAGTTKDQS
tara:strand:- start:2874 stop:3113 length:240 start_codon:yes stop_codon:yes gene_type:complete